MALSDAVSTSVGAVIANWSESLYHTRAYREVVDSMNRAIVRQAQEGYPYYPSHRLKSGTESYAAMRNIEDRMYREWINTQPELELATDSNPARIRQILGRDPSGPRETFDHFLIQAVNDQQDFILTTFRRVQAEQIDEAKRKFYEKTVAELKKKKKLAYSILATRNHYGGDPFNGIARHGDVLAFESELFVPYLYPGESARLIWQVVNSDRGEPVKGLYKEKRLKEGDVTETVKIRFRIDDLESGQYATVLKRCIQQSCDEEIFPFSVSEAIHITRIYLSPDQKGTKRIHRDPLSREARYVQVEYRGSAEILQADVLVSEKNGKEVDRIQKKWQGKQPQRLGIPLNMHTIREGKSYELRVSLQDGKGTESNLSLTFTPKFYPLEISGPSKLSEGKKTIYSFKAPDQLKPPFQFDRALRYQELSHLTGNQFLYEGQQDGERTIALALVDADGRRALGFKKVQVQRKTQALYIPQSAMPKEVKTPPSRVSSTPNGSSHSSRGSSSGSAPSSQTPINCYWLVRLPLDEYGSKQESGYADGVAWGYEEEMVPVNVYGYRLYVIPYQKEHIEEYMRAGKIEKIFFQADCEGAKRLVWSR
jgi:hypothetical protein